MERAVRSGEAVVLDARASERHLGGTEPFDVRAGHIPGARNLPWTESVDRRTGRFLRAEEAGSRVRASRRGRGDATIVHCRSGVTSCHHVLAMELAGLSRPRLYVGSWSEWSRDPSRSLATGDDPGML